MSNDYYIHTTYPPNSAVGSAANDRAELAAIAAGFDKLPGLTGNADKLVIVNAAGNALTVSPVGSYRTSVAWTPEIECTTPGDLNIVYSTQIGVLHQIGQLILVQWELVTSTFTHTTASGNMWIAGLPNISVNAGTFPGSLLLSGITKANYTQFAPTIGTSQNTINIEASASAQAQSTLAITEMPTGGVVKLSGSLWYLSQS